MALLSDARMQMLRVGEVDEAGNENVINSNKREKEAEVREA